MSTEHLEALIVLARALEVAGYLLGGFAVVIGVRAVNHPKNGNHR